MANIKVVSFLFLAASTGILYTEDRELCSNNQVQFFTFISITLLFKLVRLSHVIFRNEILQSVATMKLINPRRYMYERLLCRVALSFGFRAQLDCTISNESAHD